MEARHRYLEIFVYIPGLCCLEILSIFDRLFLKRVTSEHVSLATLEDNFILAIRSWLRSQWSEMTRWLHSDSLMCTFRSLFLKYSLVDQDL